MKKQMDKQSDRNHSEMLADERAFRLMEAFSGVDEELLARCERSEKVVPITALRKNAMKYGRACAAVVCLFVVGALTWGGYHVGVDNAATGAAECAKEEAIHDYGNETAAVAPDMELYSQVADVTAEGTESTGGAGSGDDAESGKVEGVEYNAVSESGEKEDTASGAESDKLVSPQTKAREITLEQAYKIAGLGEYVPTSVPAGYVLESVYYYDKEEPQKLTVCWSRGMDTIFWHIQQEAADALNIVDVEKTETYDEYLYEIPHAETVPKEYWEIFMNPVCTSEDFNPEFVEKRMISRGGDAGDTDTPRGNFSVLYPSGTLVKFNGRGTAQEVWEMFSSIEND